MLEEIRASLVNLDIHLETLWLDYLDSKPKTWLRNLESARARLVEAQDLYDTIVELQGYISTIRFTIDKSRGLNPVRKEN